LYKFLKGELELEKKVLAKDIVEQLGGPENITESWHCITRLRFNLINENLVDLDKISQLDGVLGAQFQSGQYQIIIGAEVTEVFDEVSKQLKGKISTNDSKRKMKPLDLIFDVISSIFTPILPAIVGSGVIKGFMALFVALGWMPEDSSTYLVLNIFSDAAFYFLPFLIAMTAAKKFKARESLALTLAAILLYPTLLNGAVEGVEALKYFGLSIPLYDYTSSVLPIILGVLLLSYVDKWVNKLIPKSVSIVFTPLLSILITAPLLLVFIAPLGNLLGVYLESIFTVLFEVAGPVAGLLLGGSMPIIVITGMHYAFFPSTFASFDKFGYDMMLLPMNLVANMAQTGAVLGVLLRSKKSETKSLAASTIIPTIFGITEPAIYGVTLRLKKPFYAALLGGAVGGCFYGVFTVKTTAFSIPGILSLPSYMIPGTNNFIYAIIGFSLSILVSFLTTMILGFDEEVSVTTANTKSKENLSLKRHSSLNSDVKSGAINLFAPITGEVVNPEEVDSSKLYQEVMGKSIAIVSESDIVYAPCDGVILSHSPTRSYNGGLEYLHHKLAINSNKGVELLIQIELASDSFDEISGEVLVTEGQEVSIGQKLLEFKIEEIETNLNTWITVTNSTSYLDIIQTPEKYVIGGKTKMLICIN